MPYWIGTDEAGYGPNLGPLVISASAWWLPPELRATELMKCLRGVIVHTPQLANQEPHQRLAIADSKVLFQPAGGLRHLERGLWAAWGEIGQRPTCFSDVFHVQAAAATAAMKRIPWYADYDIPLPRDAQPGEWEPAAAALHDRLASTGARLVALQSHVVFAEQFNTAIRRLGSKGALLSHATLDLVCKVIRSLPNVGQQQSISVVCDKHGGRNRYAGLLFEHFPHALIDTVCEGRQQSVYRVAPPPQRIEFHFLAKAESHLPVAMASLASKYLRELAMGALNHFWCCRVDNLRPTAGYPQDAKRFMASIAPAMAALKVDDHQLWRIR